MHRDDLPPLLLAGALSGGITGTVDTVAAVFTSPHTWTAAVTVTALIFAASLLLPVGIFIGSAVGLVSPLLPARRRLRRMATFLFKPRNIAMLAAIFVGGTAGIVIVGYKRGILIDAVDFRPLLLGVAFLVFFAIAGRLLRSHPKGSAVGTVSALAISLPIIGVLMSGMGSTGDALALLGADTSFVKYTIQGVKSGFDRDGDGFSTLLCGEDCDCDDRNPAVSPGALDIPDNGVDEDCTGADLTLAAMNGAVGQGRETRSPFHETLPDAPYNILLITVDTLRADRMHVYGHYRETTPNLDRFAKTSVRFAEVRSQGPSTRHVFPVLLTGRYFSSIALKKGKKWSKLLPSNKTFAEYLKEVGYRTVAVLPYFRFKEHSGFQQGFDIWEPILDGERDATWEPTGDLVTDRGITHLDALSKEKGPWLLWLHYFDPHASYVRHDDQVSFGDERADRYDGEILFVDRQIQRFLDAFEKTGLSSRTATIVTSDHGEGIGLETDHGFNYHGFSLFDSETRVPLMIRAPGVRPAVIDECVGIIDVPPTLLALAGIDTPKTFQGVSLVTYLKGNTPRRDPFIMQLPETKPQEAIVAWPHKLIWHVKTNRYGLYNLETDPNEQTNLADIEHETAARLTNLLKAKLFALSREQFGAVTP